MAFTSATVAISGLLTFAAGAAVASVLVAAAHSTAALTDPFALCTPATQVEFPGEAPFLAENDVAMNKMMADMAARPTGDVDRDFVAMMTPHHQGAIEMAKSVLRYGHNEQLRRLAQEIIVTQQQEIAAMRLAIGDKPPPSAASPTQIAASPIRRPDFTVLRE